MGALSALVVSPCVSAPLAGVLVYISATGDALLGGMALFSLGLGMGIPLIVLGTTSAKLLPRSGSWMEQIKYFWCWINRCRNLVTISRLDRKCNAMDVGCLTWRLWSLVRCF